MSRAPEHLRKAVIDSICEVAPIAFEDANWIEPRAGYAEAPDETLIARLEALLDEMRATDYLKHRDTLARADLALQFLFRATVTT